METAEQAFPPIQGNHTQWAMAVFALFCFHFFSVLHYFPYFVISSHNVHVSLPVYIQLQPLPCSSASAPTITQPLTATCPIFVRSIFIVSISQTTIPPYFPGSRTLSLYVGCVCRIINSVLLKGILEFLHGNKWL